MQSLSPRQQRILRVVADSYVETGRPVGSKIISERLGSEWSSSTIRAEFGLLETGGYLTHPHTSAGRIPTDRGLRLYADELLSTPRSQTAVANAPDLGLSTSRYEVAAAMRAATEALARITNLLALATAPPPSVARIHRVEVLLLQPNVVMVVIIASDGEVGRRMFRFTAPVDRGLVEWAGSYLNERLDGLALGASMIADRLTDPGLGTAEQGFIEELAPAFTEMTGEVGSDLYFDGAARLLSEEHAPFLPSPDGLMDALDRRAELIATLRATVNRQSVFCWIGSDSPAPELGPVTVIGASYGLGYRNLGAVGVVGPQRMDYAGAIDSVRAAAGELSRFFEAVYEN